MVSFPKISPNLLLGVGGIIAIIFLVSQIRKAGAEVSEFVTTTKPVAEVAGSLATNLQSFLTLTPLPTDPIFGETGFFANLSKSISEFKFPEIKLPGVTLPVLELPEFQLPSIEEVFKPITDIFVPKEEPTTFMDVGAAAARGARGTTTIIEPEPLPTQQLPITTEIISELPIEQPFVGGGISFIGATIRENPIDTLSEAIALGLTASQAADFLAATGGVVTPSQIELGLVDPDIQNIVAGFIGGGEGQAFPVSSTPLETLSIKESEALKAAEFTCKEFGLNCELVDGMMA